MGRENQVQNRQSRGAWVIVLSLIIAMILTILPIPQAWQPFRPDWLFLVLSYWIMALPRKVGILWAFIWGVILDSLLGSTLGLHSFSFCLFAFIFQMNHQRIRIYPIWKQALFMGMLSVLYLALVLWLSRVAGSPESDLSYWISAGINVLLWPWLFILLRDIRRYFRVS